MLLSVKSGGGVGFARKEAYEYDGKKYEADLKDGDIVTFLDSGVEEKGEYGMQNNFKIETRNGTKKLSLNQMSTNILVLEFGGDTEQWVGKKVKVLLKKGVYAGKKGIACYLVTEGYSLDEYGELVKTQANSTTEKSETTDEVKVEDIPF